MKTIHIAGAGGAAGVGLTRCLKDYYDLTGEDTSPWGQLMMECPQYKIGDPADMVICVPDSSVWQSSFTPSRDQIELCQDKAATAKVLGNYAPKTYWVRDTTGAGGKGAQMASELLPGRNYSVEYVFQDDAELTSFQKQRISYSVKHKTTGLENRGSSMVSVCTNEGLVFKNSRIALAIISEITDTPLNGFYGVDLCEDENGIPKVTEINAGRLLTASYSFFHLTGWNLPLIGAQAFFKEDYTIPYDYPVGYGIIRQVDQLPRLFPPEITKGWL